MRHVVFVVLALGGCLNAVPILGSPCPCPEDRGYVCCAARCIGRGEACPASSSGGRDGAAASSGAGGAAASDGPVIDVASGSGDSAGRDPVDDGGQDGASAGADGGHGDASGADADLRGRQADASAQRGCSSSSPCPTGYVCAAGTCKLKAPRAAACTTNAECSTGACADGVCCDRACPYLCRACNLPGSVGECAPIAAGQDPDRECPAEPAATCGRAGACDGQGACRFHPRDTICAAESCTDVTQTHGRTCDGAGRCVGGGQLECLPFRCGETACRTSCQNDDHCGADFTCLESRCRRRI